MSSREVSSGVGAEGEGVLLGRGAPGWARLAVQGGLHGGGEPREARPAAPHPRSSGASQTQLQGQARWAAWVGVGAVPGAGASGDGKSEWGAGPRYGKADAQR